MDISLSWSLQAFGPFIRANVQCADAVKNGAEKLKLRKAEKAPVLFPVICGAWH
jgi:hypothetical protein